MKWLNRIWNRLFRKNKMVQVTDNKAVSNDKDENVIMATPYISASDAHVFHNFKIKKHDD